jgi:thiamine transport system substrate-binding protein
MRNQPHRPQLPTTTRALVAMVGLGLATTACSTFGAEPAEQGDRSQQVVVATHDSWNMSKKVMREFTEQTGYQVKIQPQGDAGSLTNKLVLTQGSPIADLVYGIDNTFASRAVEAGVLAPYEPETAPGVEHEPEDPEAARQLTPVDFSDVCLNIDDVWFAEHDIEPPSTLDDLTDPTYEGLFVTPGATTSSPGLAFLLTTIAKYDDGWQDYWRALLDNGAKITSGWSDAYQVDFTAGGGGGDRPIVLSYASSPPFTIPEGGNRPTTSALLDTCFRQVEYAAVLEGAEDPEGAKAFIDFMVGKKFQAALPENMYVYPVDETVELPELWAKYADAADDPWQVPADQIEQHRDDWLRAWGDLVNR